MNFSTDFLIVFDENSVISQCRAYAVPSKRMRGWAGHYIM